MKIIEFVQLLLSKQIEFRLPFVKKEPSPEEFSQMREKTWNKVKGMLLEGDDLQTYLDGTPAKSKVANLGIQLG